MRKSVLFVFIFLISGTSAISQFVVVPIPKKPKKDQSNRTARIQALQPMLLPFWDDFSFSNTKNYPHDSLWQYGNSVLINFGKGINPLSLGVATFDGLDSLGKPYNVNDPLAKGYADKLVSRVIRMDTVDAAQRDSTFLSFYYQPGGNVEPPDPGDHLELDLLANTGQWENAISIQNDGTMETDTFTLVMLQITDPKFFHKDFQFRFRNYGRLSGPYDNWHVDYVFLNSHRAADSLYVPDRTITTPLTSIFNEYWSIPKKHFLTNIAGNLTKPTLGVYNFSAAFQPLTAQIITTVISYTGATRDSAVLQLDEVNMGSLLQLTRETRTIDSLPPASFFDLAADSFRIKIKFGLNTNDNALPVDPVTGLPQLTDYDSLRFGPIDFRVNDTIQAQYMISNYYAYDDGTAEYGIGLNQPGSQAAYLFDMKTTDPDTIIAVDIYFPRFGDASNQSIQLKILRDLTDTEESTLYQAIIPVERSEMDTLHRYVLNTNTVGVQGNFYIAWKQSSAVSIPFGWDKNTDSGSKIYFNLNGFWESNITEHGSIMIRPVFGKGGVVTGLSEKVTEAVHAYPNPNSGTFYLSGQPEYVELFDLAGRPVGFVKEENDHQTKIELTHAYPGLYVLRTFLNKKSTTQKILVRP